VKACDKEIRLSGGLASMGKTVPSYRMALESEIARWQGFARALRVDEREAFEAIMDSCRSYASAGSNATNPVLFEPMAISIMLHLQMRVTKLEKELNELKHQ
jgi:hypothetical protein